MTRDKADTAQEFKVERRYPVRRSDAVDDYGLIGCTFGESFDIEEYDTYTVTKSHKYGRRVSSDAVQSKQPSGFAETANNHKSINVPYIISKVIFYFCLYHFIKWISADKPNPDVTIQGIVVYAGLFIVLPYILSVMLKKGSEQ